jgi:hypothetical protein
LPSLWPPFDARHTVRRKENEQIAGYQVVGRSGELRLLNRRSAAAWLPGIV